jgi:hypothetical protein
MAFGTRIREKEGEKIPTRFRSKRQEEQVAKAVGGQRTPNSGATMFQKGDVKADKLLVECKTKMTPSESISIKKEWLIKNREEAVFMGKPYSVVAFNFGPDEPNYYILDEDLFIDFLDFLNNKEL